MDLGVWTDPMKIAYRGYVYSSLLEAYNTSDIKKLYGEKIKKFLGDNGRSNEEGDIDKLIYGMNEVDPTSDKKWLGVIAEWLLTKRPEDLETQIFEYLGYFKKLLDLNPGKFGGMAKQLSKGKVSFDKFKEFINSNSELLGKTRGQTKVEDKVGDFPKVAENDNYVMYKVDRWVEGKDNKHFCFQGDVDWCVKYQNYFNNYKPPYYYILDKSDGSEFALLHVESQQLKDIRDVGLNVDSFGNIADLVLPFIENMDNIGFGGDFDVIYKHFSLNSGLEGKYPRIQKARLVKLFLKNMEIGEYDQMSKMLEWDLDLESKSDYILYAMSRNRSMPEELVDKLLNYPTFNINASISERSGLVVVIREHNNTLADKMLSNSKFDYGQKGEGGINLFNELVISSGLKSTPSILDAFGLIVLSHMNDSKIGGEGVRHMMLKNIIKTDMLRTLEYLVSSNIEMPYNSPYSILFDIIRLMEEHISKKESVLPKMFSILVNSGRVDINATHFSMKETVLQYITRITKYMDKSGNGYKYLNDCTNALISAGAR